MYQRPSPAHRSRKNVWLQKDIHEAIEKRRKDLAEQGLVLTIPQTITHIIDEWEVMKDGAMRSNGVT